MTRLILGAVCIFLAGIARADDYQAAYDLLKRALAEKQPLIDRQETIKPTRREWIRSHEVRLYPILPPEEFDRPYGGELVIVRVDSPDLLIPYCRNPSGKVLGCAEYKHLDKKCIIYLIPDGFYTSVGYDPNDVFRHEVAHCNGWPSNHPGARKQD
jgi:hypothetical protein